MRGLSLYTINLLPARVVTLQRRRRLWRRLTAIEAVIFFVAFTAVFCANLSVHAAREEADNWEARLKDVRYAEADRLADAVKAAETALNSELSLLDTLPAARFNFAWLETINQNTPSGVLVTGIDMRETQITLTAVASFELMEEHRARLAKTGLFTQVLYGTMARTEDGAFQYTLSLGVE